MTTILPKFDFSDETEAKVDTTNKAHSSIREPHNALSPIVFNEYERVMELAAAAIGDPDFSDILAQNNTNIGSALREVYDLKFNVAGGTVTGSVTVNGALSSPQLTSSTTTLAPIIVNSNVMVHGLNVQYLNGHPAPVGDIVGTTDSQTLTNKTINGGNIIPPSSASPNQTTAGQLEWNSTLLKLTTGTGSGTTTLVDAESTQDISGVKTISDNLVLSGDNAGLVLRNDTDFRISAEDDQIRIHADSTGDGTFETSVFVADNSLETVSIYGKELITSYDNQIITGIKTFSTNFPVTPSTAPTTDYQMANKKYVDDISQGSLRHDIVINNQTEFDATFTETIPADTSIFIKKKDTAYVLNHAVVLSSGVRILSDGAIVNRGNITAKFSTTYKAALGVTDASDPGATPSYVTTATSAEGVFFPGDVVLAMGVQSGDVHRVLSVSGNQVNLVNPRNLTSCVNLYSYQQHIYTNGWIFDGQGNVNGLGPSTESFTLTGNGGAFDLTCCANSIFKAEVRNCNVIGIGGAYFSLLSNNLIIDNIHDCTATDCGGGVAGGDNSTISNIQYCSSDIGGGCHSCNYSTISNINNCSAASKGGGCYDCDYSNISNIVYCSADIGGGCYDCNYSNISNINNCSADFGGGCSICRDSVISNINNCSATSEGGGCHFCTRSTISNIRYCSAGTNGGGCAICSSGVISNIDNCSADIGGGCYDCDYSNISNIVYCSATKGGGCSGCNDSDISIVNSNTTNTNNTGACTDCNNCFYHGSFCNNSNPNSTTPNITNGGTSLAMCIAGIYNAKVVTTQGNWTNW